MTQLGGEETGIEAQEDKEEVGGEAVGNGR